MVRLQSLKEEGRKLYMMTIGMQDQKEGAGGEDLKVDVEILMKKEQIGKEEQVQESQSSMETIYGEDEYQEMREHENLSGMEGYEVQREKLFSRIITENGEEGVPVYQPLIGDRVRSKTNLRVHKAVDTICCIKYVTKS